MKEHLETHGLSIGLERAGNEFFLSIKAVGKLTHEDYKVMTPMIDSALEEIRDPRVKALIDGTELEGWKPRAAWDDFKLGLKHGNEFEKIAIYGNKHWQEVMAKIGSWFLSGEIRFFDDKAAALAWLKK